MENKLVCWAGNAEDKNLLVKCIKEHLDTGYLIKQRELMETDNGFRFLFDDETGSEIKITFNQLQDSLYISVAGNCSWDVVRLHNEILSLLPNEAESADEYRERLRKCNYPEEVLAKMTDEDCEGECDAIGVSL